MNKLSEIPKGKVYIRVASEINVLISGAYRAAFNRLGNITLVYTDGTRESVLFTPEESETLLNTDNWFSIISAVQSRRGKNE